MKDDKDIKLFGVKFEYVALSEAVKEINFIYYLMNDFQINAKLPIILKIEINGAIFMSEMF